MREQPVPRRRVFIGALLVFAFLGGLIATVNALRHPLPEGFETEVGLEEDDSDPRLPILCEDALPREGQQRESAEEPDTDTQDTTPIRTAGIAVTSSQLYDCPETYAGATVRYTGEVIGAVLERDGGAWVQLNDDIYADIRGPLPAHRDYRGGNAGVGVFIPPDLANQIDWVGGPSTRGDRLTVTGTFERVDPQSLEVAVIRADSGEVQQPGGLFVQQNLPARRVLGIALALVAVCATVAERIVVRRR